MPYIHHNSTDNATVLYNQDDLGDILRRTQNHFEKLGLTASGELDQKLVDPSDRLIENFNSLSFFKLQHKTTIEVRSQYPSIANEISLMLNIIINALRPYIAIPTDDDPETMLRAFAMKHFQSLRHTYQGFNFATPRYVFEKIVAPYNLLVTSDIYATDGTFEKSIDLYYDFSAKTWVTKTCNQIKFVNTETGKATAVWYNTTATMPIDILGNKLREGGFFLTGMEITGSKGYVEALYCFLYTWTKGSCLELCILATSLF